MIVLIEVEKIEHPLLPIAHLGVGCASRADVDRLAGGYAGSLQPDGSLEVELQAIMGATNELGFSSLSCREI